MRLRSYLLFAAGLILGPGAMLRAQDPPPLVLGDFETQGSVTAGYRFTTIKGRREKFLELFGLREGLRLMDFNILGRAKAGSTPFADSYSLNVSGLGGDPFSGGQLTVRKNRLYDLRINYRQSYFYWDRNDDVLLALPQPPPSPPIQRGLTTNHDWATVRRFGSASLLLHATNNLRFNFEFNRSSRDGTTYTTRVLEYFEPPSLWGSFLRDNPYRVEGPLNEAANRIAAGASYSWRDWNFHYRLGYQTSEQNVVWNNVTSPQRSINVDRAPTANELLTNASWSEFRRLKSPASEFSYSGKVNTRLNLRGGYIFYRYRGPASMDASFAGTARSNSGATTFASYTVSQNSRSQVSEPNHVVDQGFSLRVYDWWNVHADYRYSRFAVDSRMLFHSLRNGTTAADGEVVEAWRTGTHQVDLNMEFTPLRSLVFRPGIRYLKRDIEASRDGVIDPVRSQDFNTVWPTVSVFYQQSRLFSVRGDFQSMTNSASYTRISPHTDISGRLVLRFRPTERLSIENNLVLRTRNLRDTSFNNTIRSNALTVSYALDRRFSVYGGFTYDSYLAKAAITFLRGTPPLTATWRDQTISRVWQGGLASQPWRGVGFNVSGNFVRTTGAGEISGEPPTFGPMTWPLITATAYYDFPQAGRLSIDLQRTYYLEELVHGNDFQANLLTLRWTKDF